MKKTIKRGIAVLEAAALAAGLCGCAGTGSREATEEGLDANAVSEKDDATEHLLEVWSDYLQVMDNMYAGESWAFSYIEQFLGSEDWNDLVKARTACIASVRNLDGLAMTKEDLSREEYQALFEAGVDTEYQSMVFDEVSDEVEKERTVCRGMLESLEGDIFFSDGLEELKKKLEIYKSSVQNMCRYICTMTNYLLLSLGDHEKMKEYWETMPENYPALCTEPAEWNEDLQQAMSAADKILDEIEGLNLELAGLLSSASASLYRLNRMIEDEDIEAVYASASTLKNTPDLLPVPYWYDPMSVKYINYVRQEDGSLLYPESGEELLDADYGAYCMVEGYDTAGLGIAGSGEEGDGSDLIHIEAEDIELYVAAVKGLAENTWKEAEEDKWVIAMPGYSVQITLEEGIATLLFAGEDITFVPEWYLKKNS